MHISATVVIDRPIGEVFAFATDLARWSEWISTVTSVQRTSSGPLDVGATFVQIERFSLDSSGWLWEVTAYQPPRLLTCRRVTDSRATICYVCEGVEGSTRLTVSTSGDVAGLFAGGAEVRQAIAAQIRHDLRRFECLFPVPALDYPDASARAGTL